MFPTTLMLIVLFLSGVYAQTFEETVAQCITTLVKQFNIIDHSIFDVVILRIENERFRLEGDDLVAALYRELKMESSIWSTNVTKTFNRNGLWKAAFTIVISDPFDKVKYISCY